MCLIEADRRHSLTEELPGSKERLVIWLDHLTKPLTIGLMNEAMMRKLVNWDFLPMLCIL
jgi:hypothetical protein